MSSIGPFSIRVVAVAVAALLAWLVARFMQRRPPDGPHQSASSLILDTLLLGLIAARVGYVAQWGAEYAAAPRSIVALGDGGFDWRIGVAAALGCAGWRLRRLPALRRPVLAGMAAGLVAWGIAQGMLASLQRAAPPFATMRIEALDARRSNETCHRLRSKVITSPVDTDAESEKCHKIIDLRAAK